MSVNIVVKQWHLCRLALSFKYCQLSGTTLVTTAKALELELPLLMIYTRTAN